MELGADLTVGGLRPPSLVQQDRDMLESLKDCNMTTTWIGEAWRMFWGIFEYVLLGVEAGP